MAPDADAPDNPFAPPPTATLRSGAGVAGMAAFTRYALLATLLANLVMLLGTLGGFTAPPEGSALAEGLVLVSGLAGLVYLGTFLASVVGWSIWSYRLAAALRAGGAPLTTSPGWVVGWWFVPLANLVMPLRVHRELFELTAPPDDGPRAPSWLTAWWLLWVGSNALGNLSLRVMGTPAELPVDLIAGIVSVASAALAIQVVDRLTERFAAWEEGR